MAGIFEDLKREWDRDVTAAEDWFTRPHAPQAPAAMPVNLRTQPHQGETMALGTDLRALADRLDTLGEEVVTKTEALVASPVGTLGLGLLHELVGLQVDPKLIERALGGVDALLQAYKPQQAA